MFPSADQALVAWGCFSLSSFVGLLVVLRNADREFAKRDALARERDDLAKIGADLLKQNKQHIRDREAADGMEAFLRVEVDRLKADLATAKKRREEAEAELRRVRAERESARDGRKIAFAELEGYRRRSHDLMAECEAFEALAESYAADHDALKARCEALAR